MVNDVEQQTGESVDKLFPAADFAAEAAFEQSTIDIRERQLGTPVGPAKLGFSRALSPQSLSNGRGIIEIGVDSSKANAVLGAVRQGPRGPSPLFL